MIEKKILSEPTEFLLSYLTYTTAEEALTGVTHPCGPFESIIYETLPVSESNEIFSDVVTQSTNPLNWLTDDGLKYTVQPNSNEQASGAYPF